MTVGLLSPRGCAAFTRAMDTSSIAAPSRLKAASLLKGIRGAAAVDVQAVARVVALVGAQMRANPQITEIDINPLVAYPERVLALDALVVVNNEAQ